jgi:thiol:disulfide interchange protein DsbD
VTVTYIGGAAAGNRRRAVALSLTYVTGLALMYASLGVAAALLGKIFGEFTRSPWVFGAVGVIIAGLGLGMLDVFTIPTLMTSLQGQGARRGGFLGAALMGVAAGFVAAPCTAPVLGLLLAYVGQTRDVVWGGSLLFVFALGLGLLLLLLGIFSGLLTSLPRAGAWMDRIKKGFGVAMILIGAWFIWEGDRPVGSYGRSCVSRRTPLFVAVVLSLAALGARAAESPDAVAHRLRLDGARPGDGHCRPARPVERTDARRFHRDVVSTLSGRASQADRHRRSMEGRRLSAFPRRGRDPSNAGSAPRPSGTRTIAGALAVRRRRLGPQRHSAPPRSPRTRSSIARAVSSPGPERSIPLLLRPSSVS